MQPSVINIKLIPITGYLIFSPLGNASSFNPETGQTTKEKAGNIIIFTVDTLQNYSTNYEYSNFHNMSYFPCTVRSTVKKTYPVFHMASIQSYVNKYVYR